MNKTRLMFKTFTGINYRPFQIGLSFASLFLLIILVNFIVKYYRYPIYLADLGDHYLRPFVNYKQALVDFGKDYNLGLCLIEKCASTLNVGINCFVKKGEFFERLGIRISDGWSKTSWCLDDYSTFNLSNPSIDVVELGFKEKRMIAIVREPLDRFISAFINKCIDEEDWTESFVHCYDCHKNMSCVVKRAYNRMMEISKAKHFELDYTDRHFTPLSWYCNFKKHFRKYTLIKKESSSDGTERMLDELELVFRERGVEEWKIDEIRNQTLSGKTHHSTSHTIRRQKYEKEMFTNPYVMQTLKKMYYYDYLIFNFDTAVFDSVKLPEDY